MSDAGSAAASPTPSVTANEPDYTLFWACFIALIATAFGFIIRALIMDDLAAEFNLTETQKGEIFGVGLWPFAISIVLFSLIIDRIGYGKAMVFAFVCHVASAIIAIMTPSLAAGDSQKAYWILYLSNFVVALGNGTVEAVVNPVVATMFAREKTKWLNILHAGWPGGLVLGGLLTLLLTNLGVSDWQYKIGLIFIPVLVYGVMMIPCKFPVSERVAAGVSYRDMLREFGMGGALIVSFLMVSEIGRVFGFSTMVNWLIIAALTIGFGVWIGFAIGRPLFLFLLVIMVPLATTELGTDSWIAGLMEPLMERDFGISGGWVLVYTSLIMMILRFFAGPIVHRISPLGLLAASSVIAAGGLVFLSQAAGVTILIAATLYGIGKTFFWPTMLGVVAEQFPKGGALTLNATGAVGMLGVGVVGAVFLGYIQDTTVESRVKVEATEIHADVTETKKWVFGELQAVNPDAVKELPKEDKEQINEISNEAKQQALATVAIFPIIMLVAYLILIGYFKSRGGYQAEVLTGHAANDEEFTGGVEGPADM
ncbi:MFS transporter [Thalassoroseus pseudoceratinae]|uniref:MFS transporter n=1 Tax=Thalassoroseus pseudoceratinae TaxID=2713176 RepID=UPI001420E135|nr:MFS transporter [Thalassoroseus pseudoceratinae]